MRRAQRRPHLAEDEGFSLVEVMVSLVLFALLASGAATLVFTALRTSRNNESRVVAANLASQEIEKVRGLPPASVPLGDVTTNASVDGRGYAVRDVTSYQVLGGTANACAGASGPAQLLRIDVTVTWNRMAGSAPVRDNAIKALPVSGAQGTNGTLTVPVQDRNGNPLSGVTVTETGGPSGTPASSVITGADGCAVFSALPPATNYLTSVSRYGYVDPIGNPTPTGSLLAITAGTVTKASAFVYDLAAQLTVTVPTTAAGNASYPLATPYSGTVVGVSLGNAAFSGGLIDLPSCGSPLCSVRSGSTYAVAGLFPSTSGYTAWPGTCSDSMPPTLGAATVLSPGGTATATASSPGGVLLTVPPASRTTQRYAVHTSGGCLQGVGGTKEVYVLPLPPTGSNTIQSALPDGTWTITTDATGATAGTSVNVIGNQVPSSSTAVS